VSAHDALKQAPKAFMYPTAFFKGQEITTMLEMLRTFGHIGLGGEVGLNGSIDR
jgi:hypothetical protein